MKIRLYPDGNEKPLKGFKAGEEQNQFMFSLVLYHRLDWDNTGDWDTSLKTFAIMQTGDDSNWRSNNEEKWPESEEGMFWAIQEIQQKGVGIWLEM